MAAAQDKKEKVISNRSTTLEVEKADQTVLLDPSTIPWTQWKNMEYGEGGIDFKILDYNEKTGKTTLIMRSSGPTATPIHKHAGEVEVYLIKGHFGYAADGVNPERSMYAGWYMREPVDCVHKPFSREAVEMFTIIHGPIIGFDEDGTEVAITTSEFYEAAAANNAVGHLKPRS